MALVAVLPEYVIEIYFAFTAHVEFVTASLTGSTRLLLSFAVGMPAIASLVLARRGGPQLEVVELKPQRRLDLAIIATASLYAPLIVLRGHLAWTDAIVLIGLYVLYLRRVVHRLSRAAAPRGGVGRARQAAEAAAPALGRSGSWPTPRSRS